MDAVHSWIDGVAADRLALDDRGLQYGDGLFETVRIRAGKPRFLEAHLARLATGCERLRLPFTAFEALRGDIGQAMAHATSPGLLKIIVTRGSARRRGYAIQGDEVPRRIVSWYPGPAFSAASLDLGFASFRIGDQPALAGLKHLNRLENVLAASESRAAGAFDMILRGMDGRLVCGAMCNLFMVHGDKVSTPAVDRAGVAGVMRGVVLRECPTLGIETQVRDLTLDDLHQASEVLVTNARIGVVPVRRVGEHSFTMDTVGRRIAAHVETLDA